MEIRDNKDTVNMADVVEIIEIDVVNIVDISYLRSTLVFGGGLKLRAPFLSSWKGESSCPGTFGASLGSSFR